MSFHYSNFGQFSNELKQYADLDGFVPEAGDDWFRFRWDAATRWNKDTWQEHVEAAVRATVRAERALAEWRGDLANAITAILPDGRQGILTTEHAASSYGQAVLVVDGQALGYGEVGPVRIDTAAGREVARRSGYQVADEADEDLESFLAIDIGFDLRARDTLVHLDNWRHGVKCHPTPGSCTEEAVVRSASLETVAETLARAGYSLIVATTANGRDVRCTPKEVAPSGDWPSYEWTGPAWAVQAKHDNYWCVGPSLTAILLRSGWRDSELTPLEAAAPEQSATTTPAAEEGGVL